jgi:TetR/AcrR family transcriptional regulator, cholesterol catabolism regulator
MPGPKTSGSPARTKATGTRAKRKTYELGQRALAQMERRRRIIAAAEAIFHDAGFDEARMRDIAERAGVATGTLFLYAPDKRSLLLLVLHQHLVECVEQAFATLDRSAPLVDQVVHIFHEQYRYLAKDPKLSLRASQESAFFPTPEEKLAEFEVAGYLHRRHALRKRISELVTLGQQRGEVNPEVDPTTVTEVAVAVHLHEVREWLMASEYRHRRASVRAGIQQLRSRLSFALSGALARSGQRTPVAKRARA